LGLDSILDIPDDSQDEGHQLLHDSFDIKQLGTDLSTAIIGAAIHAPLPAVGGFNKLPDASLFPALIDRLEAIRQKVIRGVKVFYEWRADFKRNSDYIAIRGKDQFDFLEGDITISNGKIYDPEHFREFLETVVIPYSQSEGYQISESKEDYLVGSLARLNLNLDQIHPRTKKDLEEYLSYFPSDNIYDQDLAQQIETLHCVDDAIDILKNLKIQDEQPIKKPAQAGVGVGAVEAPRGTLYHKAEVNDQGIITTYDVIVPTAQNQINIENDLKHYFNEHIHKSEEELRLDAEKIIRCYDPCMSCATNFLKLKWMKK
jgi:coenzyme F420-reducing hydrogenase alpha subunit